MRTRTPFTKLAAKIHFISHLVNSGLGPFYDGIAHLFVTPEDLLAVIALLPCGPRRAYAEDRRPWHGHDWILLSRAGA
jgi:hypothetical protein